MRIESSKEDGMRAYHGAKNLMKIGPRSMALTKVVVSSWRTVPDGLGLEFCTGTGSTMCSCTG